MNWNSKKIRLLRLRMGWSQSDLARRLNCDWELVQLWEAEMEPETKTKDQEAKILSSLQEHVQLLELLEHQAEEEADHVTQATLAEIVLEETHDHQVDFASVKRRFSKRS